MTKAELKKTLYGYRALHTEYHHIVAEMARLESLMESPRGANLDGMPHSPGAGDPISGVVAQHVELVERYSLQLARLASAQLAIEKMIDGLEPLERTLMRLRYIDGLEWESVCVAMNYSWRQTHRMHARILDKLADPEPETE
jgi:DNA-directed RNA polymerase specialized sigma24 family protein